MQKSILSFIVVAALIIGFTSCNNPEQGFGDFKIGNHLRIGGPATVTLLPDTTTTDTTDFLPASKSYSVIYGTIKVDYKWSVEGGAKLDSTYWYKDLKAAITFPKAGAYTVKVSGTYSNGHTYNGKLKVNVENKK